MFAIVRLRNAGAHGRRFRATTVTGGLETRLYKAIAPRARIVRKSCVTSHTNQSDKDTRLNGGQGHGRVPYCNG